MEKMRLGQKIMFIIANRQYIKDNGEKIPLTEWRVSRDTKISQTTLANWKKGEVDPQARNLKTILNYLKVSQDFVDAIGEEGIPLRDIENEPLQFPTLSENVTIKEQKDMIFQLQSKIAILEKYAHRLEKDIERVETENGNLKAQLGLGNSLKESHEAS